MYNSPIALYKGIKANFSTLMQSSPEGTLAKIINRVTSNSDKEVYHVFESLPGIKEWLDQRHWGTFSDKMLTVANKSWDNGLSVDRDTINDARANLGGDVELWVKSLVDTYKSFPDELVQVMFDANTTAFDGTAIFATSRPNIDNSNTINNLLSGTSSTTYSLAEFEADYKAAKAGLLGFKDKHNKSLNKAAKLAVVIPAHLQDVASTLLSSRQTTIYVSGTQTNLYAGDAEIIVNWEQGSSDNDWYLVNIGSTFKPFLIQERKSPEWVMKDDPALYKDVKYGFDFRMGYAPLSPFSIIKTNN